MNEEPTSVCSTCGRGDHDHRAAAREIGRIVRGVIRHRMRENKVDSVLEGHWAGRVLGAAQGEWGQALRTARQREER